MIPPSGKRIHRVRCGRLRLSLRTCTMSAANGSDSQLRLKVPRQLNRAHCTPTQVSRELAQSAARCTEMLVEALTEREGRVQEFLRDGWARPWPVGPEMLCYMISHEAHHRGQVCMLAHQLGFRLPNNVTSELWNWEKLWKERVTGAAGPIPKTN